MRRCSRQENLGSADFLANLRPRRRADETTPVPNFPFDPTWEIRRSMERWPQRFRRDSFRHFSKKKKKKKIFFVEFSSFDLPIVLVRRFDVVRRLALLLPTISRTGRLKFDLNFAQLASGGAIFAVLSRLMRAKFELVGKNVGELNVSALLDFAEIMGRTVMIAK